jgi:hypothetical protein
MQARPEQIWPFLDDVTKHHDAEFMDGKNAPVVYESDATAEVTIEPQGDASCRRRLASS